MQDVWRDVFLGVNVAGYVFALFLIPRIILERRHPSATTAWMLAIALLPLAGVPLYFLIGVRRIRRHIRAKIAAAAPAPLLPEGSLRAEELPTPLAGDCGRALAAAGAPPPTAGNRVMFVSGGDEAYEAVISLVSS